MFLPSILNPRSSILVFGLVDQPVLLDPRHHVTQLRAHDLDRVRSTDAAHRLERGRARLVLKYEFLRELAGLYIEQDSLHFGAHLLVDDARTAGEVAVLG